MTHPAPAPSDPRFATLRSSLRSQAAISVVPDPPVEWEAAVSLVLRARADLELLLIKRAESHGDPWSGHMALPGGRKDPQDESLLHTAVRETLEETGVSLGATRHLGQLTRVDPATRRLPRLAVTPHVFGVPADTEAHVASHEVASVLWVPLSTLRDPAVADTYRHDAGALIRLFPSFNVAGEVVWGLTYRVLEEFLRLAP